MEGIKVVDLICGVLLIVAGLYLGFWGLFNIDPLGALFGGHESVILRIIFVLFGLAALYDAIGWKAIQRRWCADMPHKA
jgi:uncharacterized membrane protein YuzA (DUF378 family)